jgi:hypothetical protein
MKAKRRPVPLRLAEASDDTPHYYGHRERLRQRLISAGADNLPDYELLEVILFASNPRAASSRWPRICSSASAALPSC